MRSRPPTGPSSPPPPPARPAASTTRRRACRWCPPRSGPPRARCCARGPATCARTTTPWSTRSTTSSVRTAPRSTGPSATPAPTSTGRRALLTGGRAKIGMYIALRLLRDGAHTTITTRFPNDAVRRFAAMPDSADWLHRLRVVGIDLRDPAQVVALADTVAAQGPLDILINNAAQTVRRAPGSYCGARRGGAHPAAGARGRDHVRPRQRRPPGGTRGKPRRAPDAARGHGAGPDRAQRLARSGSPRAPPSTRAGCCPTPPR